MTLATMGMFVAVALGAGALAAALGYAVGPVSFIPLVATGVVGLVLAYRRWPVIRDGAVVLAGGTLLSMLTGAAVPAMLQQTAAGRVVSCTRGYHPTEVTLADGRELRGLDSYALPQPCLAVGTVIEKRRGELDLRSSEGTLQHRVRTKIWGAVALALIGIEWLRRRRPFLPGRRLVDPMALWLEPWRRDVLAVLPALVLAVALTALTYLSSHPFAYSITAALWVVFAVAYDPVLVRFGVIRTMAVWRARKLAPALGGRVVRGVTRGGTLVDTAGVAHIWQAGDWRAESCPARNGVTLELIGRAVDSTQSLHAPQSPLEIAPLDNRPLLITLLVPIPRSSGHRG